jgi:pilus assembly protein TadC
VYAGERYIFAPQALFALSVLALAATSGRFVSLAAWAAVAWLLVGGAAGYFYPVADTRDGPSWRGEVAAWKVNPAYRLFLWPPNWRVQLVPHQ